MSKFFYNGIKLPEITQSMLEGYPYCLICRVIDSVNNTAEQTVFDYILFLFQSRFYINSTAGTLHLTANGSYETYILNSDWEWEDTATGTVTDYNTFSIPFKEDGLVTAYYVWSNLAVREGSITGTVVYPYKEPTKTVSKLFYNNAHLPVLQNLEDDGFFANNTDDYTDDVYKYRMIYRNVCAAYHEGDDGAIYAQYSSSPFTVATDDNGKTVIKNTASRVIYRYSYDLDSWTFYRICVNGGDEVIFNMSDIRLYWTSHDIMQIDAEGNETSYKANSIPNDGTKKEFGDTVLPAIPSDLYSKYAYRTIIHFKQVDLDTGESLLDYYCMMLTDTKYAYVGNEGGDADCPNISVESTTAKGVVIACGTAASNISLGLYPEHYTRMSEEIVGSALNTTIYNSEANGISSELVWINYTMYDHSTSSTSTTRYKSSGSMYSYTEPVYEMKHSTIQRIADAIKKKNGRNHTIYPTNMPLEISELSGEGGGIDTSDATATPTNMELGYTGYVNGEKVTGTLELVTSITFGDMKTDNGSQVAYRPITTDEETGAELPAMIYLWMTNNSGKIILDPNATIRIPTLATNLGTALPSDVRKGKTFSSANGVLLEGTNNDLPEVEQMWNE